MATNSYAISKDVEAMAVWQGAVVVLGRFFFFAVIFFCFRAPITLISNHRLCGHRGLALASIAVQLPGVL